MSDPIRVLQIVTQMNRAGMESRLMDVYRHIDRSKVQFDFYACRREPGFFDSEIIALGGRIYYGSPVNIAGYLGLAGRFKAFFMLHPEYKIVHCQMNQWCGAILKGAKRAGVPVRIAHSRTSLEKLTANNIAKNIVKFGVNRWATHCFAVSQKAGQWLFGKKACEKGAVIIWPNAIDCGAFAFNADIRKAVREELGLADELTLLHVGNIRPEKNHAFLLQIFKAMKTQAPNAVLVIVGADLSSGAIYNKAKELGVLPGTLFLGARSDVARLLQAGDVFVFPSFYEGFPGAVLEAEAAGLPCLISDTITDEVRLSDKVVRFSLKDGAERWSEAAFRLLQAYSDDRDAPERVFEYDIHRIASEYADFYTSCVSIDLEKRGQCKS